METESKFWSQPNPLVSNFNSRPIKDFGLWKYWSLLEYWIIWRPKFCWSLSETGSGFRSRYLRPATNLVSKDFKFETEIAIGLQNLRPSIMLVSSWDRIMFRSPNLETEIYFGLKWRPLGNFRSPNWKYFETTYFGLWFRSQNLIRDRFWFRSPNSGLNWTGFL